VSNSWLAFQSAAALTRSTTEFSLKKFLSVSDISLASAGHLRGLAALTVHCDRLSPTLRSGPPEHTAQ
jgi:hypothetical protein